MSSNLIWRPVAPQPNRILPDELKFMLRKRYGNPINSALSKQDIGYLRGLKDCDVEGAQTLIDAICNHGEIVIEERF